MSGHGGEEEENYWPGYVDALTTMTMVLTFIMMVLGVVVFTLAQNVSKTVVQAVAKAAHIDTSEIASKNPTEFQAAVLGVLESRNAPSHGVSPPTPEEALEKPTVTSATPQVEPAQQQAAAHLDSETFQNQKAQAELPIRAGGVLNSRTDGVHIEFLRGGVQLNEPEIAAVKAYVEKNRNADFIVESLVVQNEAVRSGGATEGRRRAYYRAMLIRQQLVASGLPADRISLRIRDATREVQVDVVNVVTQSKVQK
jgi:hypothetical protein